MLPRPTMVYSMLQDLRYAVRGFARRPAFFATAALTLAFGIGANTALYSVIRAVLLQPLPYAHPERLVWMWGKNAQNNSASISPLDFRDYREHQTTFEHFSAFVGVSSALENGGKTRQELGALVTPEFFATLGVAPELGNALDPSEPESDQANSVILSHGLHLDLFGGRSDVLGQTLLLNNKPYVIRGVMPAGFGLLPTTFLLPETARYWIPIDVGMPEMQVRRFHFLAGVGCLKPGVTLAQAQQDLDSIAQGLAKTYPDTNTGWSLRLLPLHEELTGGVRNALWILMGAVGFVLLIACTNVANLLLVRAAARGDEIAVRRALGASSGRLLRQMLTESVVLALSGGLLGLIVGDWLLTALIRFSPGGVPRIEQSGLNSSVLAFTMLLSLGTAVLFGLAPTFQGWRIDLASALKDRGAASMATSGRNRFRRGLVMGEIAIATVLLTGAGLLVRSYAHLTSVDPGFRAEGVYTVRLSLAGGDYSDPVRARRFFEDTLRETRALPGVQAVGLIDRVPMLHLGNDTVFVKEGESLDNRDDLRGAFIRAVSGDYFEAMGIPLRAGRFFADADRKGALPTVIVSQTLASDTWPGENAVGKTLTLDVGEPLRLQVVGVVGSVRQNRLSGQPWRTLYLPINQRDDLLDNISLMVRVANPGAGLPVTVAETVSRLDPEVAQSTPVSMESVVTGSVSNQRFSLYLMAFFATLAISLALIGIYAVISQTVQQRTREIALRMALGAYRRQVMGLVVRQGLGLILAGGLIGLGAALGLTKLIENLLYEIPSHDPLTFLLVAVSLLVGALLANCLPARRATRIHPARVLRGE